MTIANENNRIDLTASGGQTTFAYNFKIEANDEIEVFLTPNGSVPDEATDLLTLTTDYTLTGVGAAGGGNIVLTAGSFPTGATAGDVVSAIRKISYDQPDAYVVGQDPAEAFESSLDRLVMKVQRIAEVIARTLKVDAAAGGTYSVPAPESNKLLGWNAAADGLENKADVTTIDAHLASTSNPHSVTKAQVGLGNADNTSDLNKPISTATQAALDLKAAITYVDSENAAQDVVIATKAATTYVDSENAAQDAIIATNTAHLSDTANPHSTTKAHVGLGNCDNTSDANKPVSTAQAAALALKYDITAADAKFLHFPDGAAVQIANVATRASNFLGFDALGEMIYSAGTSVATAAATTLADVKGFFASGNVEAALAELGSDRSVESIVRNSHFENDSGGFFVNWTKDETGGGAVAIDTTNKGSGKQSCKMTLSGLGETCDIESDFFDLEENEEYILGLSLAGSVVIGCHAYLERYDASDSFLSSVNFADFLATATLPSFNTIYSECTAAEVGAAVRGKIRIEAYATGFTGDLHIDSVNFHRRKNALEIGYTGSDFVSTNVDGALDEVGLVSRGVDAVGAGLTPDWDLLKAVIYGSSSTGTLIPTVSNKKGGRRSVVYHTNTHGSSPLAVTYNASWIQAGTLPSSIPAGQTLRLEFDCQSSDESGVFVSDGTLF